MKRHVFNRFFMLACIISVYLNISCSTLTSTSKTEVPQSQIQKLNEQIKWGEYKRIYQESAETLKAGISEDLFVNRMNEAVKKMKAIDENLNFEKSEMASLSKPLNGEFWTNSFQKVEKDNKKLEFLTQWAKEKEGSSFKLRSLSIIEPTANKKYSVYYVEQEKSLTE